MLGSNLLIGLKKNWHVKIVISASDDVVYIAANHVYIESANFSIFKQGCSIFSTSWHRTTKEAADALNSRVACHLYWRGSEIHRQDPFTNNGSGSLYEVRLEHAEQNRSVWYNFTI